MRLTDYEANKAALAAKGLCVHCGLRPPFTPEKVRSRGVIFDSCAECRRRAFDGIVPQAIAPTPLPARRPAPRMPEPVLVDDETSLEEALRASLSARPKPPSLLTPRERKARKERHEENAALARIRVLGGGAS